MKLQKESDLKKLTDLSKNFTLGKHTIHKTDVLITDIEIDYIEVIAPYGEGFSIEKYHISSSPKPLIPTSSKIIDTRHSNYSNIKAKYNNLF